MNSRLDKYTPWYTGPRGHLTDLRVFFAAHYYDFVRTGLCAAEPELNQFYWFSYVDEAQVHFYDPTGLDAEDDEAFEDMVCDTDFIVTYALFPLDKESSKKVVEHQLAWEAFSRKKENFGLTFEDPGYDDWLQTIIKDTHRVGWCFHSDFKEINRRYDDT